MKLTARLVLIGLFPPPWGGISVHLHRLRQQLDYRFGIRPTCWNHSRTRTASGSAALRSTGRYPWFCLRLMFEPAGLYHLHTTNDLILVLTPLYRLLGKRFILTCHGDGVLGRLRSTGWFPALLRWSLNQCEAVVCVGEHLRTGLRSVGLDRPSMFVLSSYIPPASQSVPALSETVRGFLKGGKGPVLVSNGTLRIVDGRDLYGLDQMIEMLGSMRNEGPPPRLLVYLYGAENFGAAERSHLDSLKQRIRSLDLEPHVLLHCCHGEEFWPVLDHAAVFLRATISEGFGISVLEAFAAGVPVVANSAVPRQAGCLVYDDGDVKAFAQQVDEALALPDEAKRGLRQHPLLQVDVAAELLSIYESLGFTGR